MTLEKTIQHVAHFWQETALHSALENCFSDVAFLWLWCGVSKILGQHTLLYPAPFCGGSIDNPRAAPPSPQHSLRRFDLRKQAQSAEAVITREKSLSAVSRINYEGHRPPSYPPSHPSHRRCQKRGSSIVDKSRAMGAGNSAPKPLATSFGEEAAADISEGYAERPSGLGLRYCSAMQGVAQKVLALFVCVQTEDHFPEWTGPLPGRKDFGHGILDILLPSPV